MSDPLSFLPLALAAANGAIDGSDSRSLVAAGVALLQRTGSLVRALHGHRSAVLLPPGPPCLVALAASDGRGALLLDPRDPTDQIARQLRSGRVGAVFTTREAEQRLPADIPRVLLDDAPTVATWREGGSTRVIDMSLHEGLRLEGEVDVEGALEEVVLLDDPTRPSGNAGSALTHRDLLAAARSAARSVRLGSRDHTLTLVPISSRLGLVQGMVAPLLAGGRVSTAADADPRHIVARLEQGGVSVLVAGAESFAAIAGHLEAAGHVLDAPVLQHCLTHDAASDPTTDASWQARWLAVTGVAITQVSM